MSNEQIVDKLKEEAKANKVSNDVFHMFAMRKRSRNHITLHALKQRMEKEGYTYSKVDLVPTLRFLAQSGLGQLKVDASGRIIGLQNITKTFQSIGTAACGTQKTSMDSYKARLKLGRLIAPSNVVSPLEQKIIKIGLTVNINNRPYKVEIPEDSTSEDVATLIAALKEIA